MNLSFLFESREPMHAQQDLKMKNVEFLGNFIIIVHWLLSSTKRVSSLLPYANIMSRRFFLANDSLFTDISRKEWRVILILAFN